MTDLKTRPTDASVDDWLASIEGDLRRKDAEVILALMADVTGEAPRIWGDSIVGFGQYHYRYASGREGDYFLTGFAVRKRDLTLYLMSGFSEFETLLANLGRHRLGKSCLYLRKLADIDMDVLRELVRLSVSHMKSEHS